MSATVDAGRDPRGHASRRGRRGRRARGRARAAAPSTSLVRAYVLEAVLFDWGGTLQSSSSGTTSCSRPGTRPGSRRSGAGRRPRRSRPVRRRDAAGAASARARRSTSTTRPSCASCSAAISDDELDRFLDAEHAAWRPARALVGSAHALLETLRDRGLFGSASSRTPGPTRRGSCAASSTSSASPSASTRSSFQARSAPASRPPRSSSVHWPSSASIRSRRSSSATASSTTSPAPRRSG